jgi:hypothetical protein
MLPEKGRSAKPALRSWPVGRPPGPSSAARAIRKAKAFAPQHCPPQAQLDGEQIPHWAQSMMNPPPVASHGVEKHVTAQVQMSEHKQEVGQLVVDPPQVTCPRSPVPQLRSTAEQVVPEQLTVLEPPQLAVQRLLGEIFRFAAKIAARRGEVFGPAAGLERAAETTGAALGV